MRGARWRITGLKIWRLPPARRMTKGFPSAADDGVEVGVGMGFHARMLLAAAETLAAVRAPQRGGRRGGGEYDEDGGRARDR